VTQWIISFVFGPLLRELVEIKAELAAIRNQGVKIMATVEDFAAIFSAFADEASTALSGIVGDLAGLKAQISGQLTTAQQAVLDGVIAKMQAHTEALKAVDAETPA
jgi:hypothetical protein